MPHKIGTVGNAWPFALAHHNMLRTIRDFCCGYGTPSTPSYTGTGEGDLYSLDVLPAAVTQNWTITATSATNFTVTGSVSGAMAAATVGTPYTNTNLAFTITNGGGSAYFDGSSLLSVPQPAYGTGNYTIEFWFRRGDLATDGTNRALYDGRGGGTALAALVNLMGLNDATYQGRIGVYINSAYRMYSTTVIAKDVWYHLALVRNAGVTKLYINGTQEGASYTDANNYPVATAYIGGAYTSTLFFIGYIADVRVSTLARYTAAFTPPTTAFPEGVGDPDWASVTLAMHMHGVEHGLTFTEETGKSVSKVGRPITKTSVTKFTGAAFVAGDTFTFTATQASAGVAAIAYEQLRYDITTADHELIMRAHGLSGTEEVYIGLKTYMSESADYYNLAAAAFTAYSAGLSFEGQPGARISGMGCNNTVVNKYWLTMNGQRIVLAMSIGTPSYSTCYLGKFFPYARPSQYPYPLVCAGMMDGAAAVRFSNTDMALNGMPYRGTRNSMALLDAGAVWRTPDAWPWITLTPAGPTNPVRYSYIRDTNGYYPLTPIILSDSTPRVYGELDGVYHITGFDNLAENTMTVGGADHVVLVDAGRNGFYDFFAMRLDP